MSDRSLPPLGRLVLARDAALRDCRWCGSPLGTLKQAKVCPMCDHISRRVAA